MPQPCWSAIGKCLKVGLSLALGKHKDKQPNFDNNKGDVYNDSVALTSR